MKATPIPHGSVDAYAPVPDPGAGNDVLPRWLAAMRDGDFEEAWRQTDRIELPRRAAGLPRGEHHLVWDGTPWAGRTVLVQCWHGLGDTIQFLRYAPLVRQTARRVIVQAQPALLPLFAGMDGIDELRNGWSGGPNPPHDVEIECMEFPYAFRSQPATLPATVPYLPVSRLRGLLAPMTARDSAECNVGLIWASSTWDSSRSLPLRCLEPLSAIHGVRLYSLQQGAELAEVNAAPFPLVPLSLQTAAIEAAASAMLQMDLIITVDTMAAHLAGALGRPAWLLLQHEADWRWMRHDNASPWYPTMRLFRQSQPGDWAGVVQQVKAALDAFVA